MRETSPRGWHRWRVAVVKSAPAAPAFDRLTRRGVSPVVEPAPAVPAAEAKNLEDIRHDLVARVRQQIADGTYETEEKWLLAEEALLRRAEGRI